MAVLCNTGRCFNLAERHTTLVTTLEVQSYQRHYDYTMQYFISGDEKENTCGELLTHAEINNGCRDIPFEYPMSRIVVNPVQRGRRGHTEVVRLEGI